jgi:hypothetical protein
MRQFHRTFIILLIACIGLGIFGSGTVHATGGFDVPKVNDQFNQFEQSPPPKQNLPAPPPVEKEKGLWDTVSQPFKSAWEWTTDTISGAWEWTTEKASALWDWFVGVLSKITEVVVDALAAAWDWIKANYKKIIVLLLIIVLAVFAVWLITTAAALIAAGSSLTILSFTISPQILSFVGYGILLGGGFGGLTSWLSGNEFMSMEMLTDTLFGCIAGGIGGLFGELIGGARFVTWLGSKIPWLPTAVKGSVGAGVEQSVFDFFKTGKINVKNTLIAIGVGGLLSYGGWLFSNNFDSIVTSINKIDFPTVKMHVLASADSNLPIPSIEIGHTKIEDTKFGAWLQKFSNNVSRTDNIITDGSHINPNGTLRPNIRYRTGEYDYIYETDDLGRIIEFNADDLRLTQRTERLPHNQNTPGKLPTDHAGHLAGDRFGGSPELDNLVSMSRSANLSVYKRLENRWARALENGQQVSVRVRINYDGNNMRPSSFDVQYTIDGVGFEQHIPN